MTLCSLSHRRLNLAEQDADYHEGGEGSPRPTGTQGHKCRWGEFTCAWKLKGLPAASTTTAGKAEQSLMLQHGCVLRQAAAMGPGGPGHVTGRAPIATAKLRPELKVKRALASCPQDYPAHALVDARQLSPVQSSESSRRVSALSADPRQKAYFRGGCACLDASMFAREAARSAGCSLWQLRSSWFPRQIQRPKTLSKLSGTISEC